MTRRVKVILIAIIVLLILSSFYILRNIGNNKGETNITSGLVLEKTEDEKKPLIILQTIEEEKDMLKEISLIVDDKNQLNSIEKGKYYYVTFYEKTNGEKVLQKAQLNETLGEMIYEKALAEDEENEDKTQKEEKEKYTAIYPSTDKLDTSELTALDKFNTDIDGDGKEEAIDLYTAAQRDSKGEIAWDDGQKWFLLVRDEDKEYVLFDEYVQLGTIKFWTYTSKDEYHILTLQDGTSVFKLCDYTYDKEKDSFIKKEIFNPEFLNVIYGSFIS